MKKLFAIILACALLSCAISAGAEDGSVSPAGIWYAGLNGVTLQLSLNEDGSYTRLLPAGFGDPVSGTWEFRDGFVILDGDEASAPEMINENLLTWRDSGLFFSRSAPSFYLPAEPEEAVRPEWFTGYWKSAWADMSGTAVPADIIGDSTDLYIEGTHAALGGGLFGDVFQDLVFENDSLTADLNSGRLTIMMQEDGILRLTLTEAEGRETILYMARTFTDEADPFIEP